MRKNIRNLKGLLPGIFFVLILSGVAYLTNAKAATTGTVTATVTAQNIALTVADGSVTYGVIGVGGSVATNASGVNDSQDAVNVGNTASNINIKGQNATNWTLGGSPSSETYSHKFCTTNCDAGPSWTALTTSYQTLKANLAVGGTQNFDLILYAPSSTTNYTQQTVDVTVQISP